MLLSLFLALAAGGATSYLIALVGVIITLFTSGRNSADTPGLNSWLRLIVLPVSVGIGMLVFFLAFRRSQPSNDGGSRLHKRAVP